jgi:hypothetical protein
LTHPFVYSKPAFSTSFHAGRVTLPILKARLASHFLVELANPASEEGDELFVMFNIAKSSKFNSANSNFQYFHFIIAR